MRVVRILGLELPTPHLVIPRCPPSYQRGVRTLALDPRGWHLGLVAGESLPPSSNDYYFHNHSFAKGNSFQEQQKNAPREHGLQAWRTAAPQWPAIVSPRAWRDDAAAPRWLAIVSPVPPPLDAVFAPDRPVEADAAVALCALPRAVPTVAVAVGVDTHRYFPTANPPTGPDADYFPTATATFCRDEAESVPPRSRDPSRAKFASPFPPSYPPE